jgi:hypothetical protein
VRRASRHAAAGVPRAPDLARLVRQKTLRRQHRVPEGGEVIEYPILAPVEALEEEGPVALGQAAGAVRVTPSEHEVVPREQLSDYLLLGQPRT